MAKKVVRDDKPVTLITTDVLTPYRKGEVFTVPNSTAKILLENGRVDSDGKEITVKVEIFDPESKSHAAALVEQRGKTEDVEPVKAEIEK